MSRRKHWIGVGVIVVVRRQGQVFYFFWWRPLPHSSPRVAAHKLGQARHVVLIGISIVSWCVDTLLLLF
eukprot:scaffold6364_cov171-Amphora_coffeaeformis.AAC.7